MKSSYSFFLFLFVTVSSLHGRNPFEFGDEQLKRYMPVKIEEQSTNHQQYKWKITEVKNNTHIVEDNEGNVRAISLGSTN